MSLTSVGAETSKRRIAIIGGGASGVISLLQLLHASQSSQTARVSHKAQTPTSSLEPSVLVDIFEPKSELSGGLAYTSNDESLILNVPAANMGFSPSDVKSFESWLDQASPEQRTQKNYPYVPRAQFKAYLNSLIETLPKNSWQHLRESVNSLAFVGGQWEIHTDAGTTARYDFVIVATGYISRTDHRPLKMDSAGSSDLILDPNQDTLQNIKNESEVAIIGSGLSAFDHWRALRSKGFNGKVTMISRHGLTPMPHHSALANHATSQHVRLPKLIEMSPIEILRVLRSLESTGTIGWLQIADQVRQQGRAIWSIWSQAERAQFGRHLRYRWEILRHRLPPNVHAEWLAEVEAGIAVARSGRIIETTQVGNKIRIRMNSGEIEADAVLMATGAKISQNDVKFEGLMPGVEVCEFGFGYRNTGAANLWFIGPASKTSFWEITAIPDIRTQVAGVVSEIHKLMLEPKATFFSKFKLHPHQAGCTYQQHFFRSVNISKFALVRAWMSAVHAVLPIYYDDRVSSDLRDFAKRVSKFRKIK